MLRAGDIVQGAYYPEVVEILRVDRWDSEYYSVATYCNSTAGKIRFSNMTSV